MDYASRERIARHAFEIVAIDLVTRFPDYEQSWAGMESSSAAISSSTSFRGSSKEPSRASTAPTPAPARGS
jgi:hypothetical protein